MSSDERRVTTFFRAKSVENPGWLGHDDYGPVVEENGAKLYVKKGDLSKFINSRHRLKRLKWLIQEIDIVVVSSEEFQPTT